MLNTLFLQLCLDEIGALSIFFEVLPDLREQCEISLS